MQVSKELRKVLKKVGGVSKEIMESKGFKGRLMRAERLKDRGSAHGLPPGEAIDVISVDALPGCPDEWVGGPGSYVCPVDSAWGLWFDWTMNDSMNTSVLTSVKGMNPVTGQKLESLALESYEEKCPVHDVKFKGDDRLCPKCEYKWPPQNYVCSPNTLWWDGFRQPDGTVRQFFFSEEEKRDIASLVMGKKNTVPAFGFVFYQPKEQRESPPPIAWVTKTNYSGGSTFYGNANTVYACNDAYKGLGPASGHESTLDFVYKPSETTLKSLEVQLNQISTQTSCSTGKKGVLRSCSEQKTSGGIILHDAQKLGHVEEQAVRAEELEKSIRRLKADVSVGAGAEIRQDLAKDTLAVKEWKSKPAAMMRLYFVFAEQFAEIVKKGVEDLKGEKDGFLKGLPVG